MSRNTVKDADSLEFIATTVRVAGDAETSGDIVIVHQRNVAIGEVAVGSRRGVHTLPILSTDTPAIHARLWWDNTNRRLTTTASTHAFAGWANTAKISGPTTIECILAGGMQ